MTTTKQNVSSSDAERADVRKLTTHKEPALRIYARKWLAVHPSDECSTCGAIHTDVDCFGEAVR